MIDPDAYDRFLRAKVRMAGAEGFDVPASAVNPILTRHQRFTNKSELVFDPFGGLFTVPYRALALGRRGRAVELSASYFVDGIAYLQAMERKLAMPTLFDAIDQQQPMDKAA